MSTTTTDAFGAKVEEYRERLGLLQKELAGKVGLSPSHLNRIEKGTRKRPGVETVRRMIKALRLTQSEAKNLVQLAGLSPKVLDFMDEVHTPVHPRIQRKKASGSRLLPGVVHPALSLTDSLLDTAFDQIEAITESDHFTEEEMERFATGLIEAAELLKKAIKPKSEK